MENRSVELVDRKTRYYERLRVHLGRRILPPMAKRAPKKKTFPTIDGVEILERMDDGIGAGRFHARIKDSGQAVDLLMLDPGGEPALEWARSLKTIESVNIPRALMLNESEGSTWVAMSIPDGETLSQWLTENGRQVAEIDALNIIMQIAMALQASHSEGITHGQLDADSIVLEHMDGGLHRVHVVWWCPPGEIEEGAEPVRDDLRALGQLLYMLITGVLPPSAQTENVENLEGDSTGAFDDVLMDWIDEERDLKGLGRPAMEALADASSFDSVSEFVEQLLPHFTEHLSTTIVETGDALESDRTFMMEVERQRLRLKELQTRERFIRDWLADHLDRIDECEGQLERYRSRLRGLENLQADISLRMCVDAERATRAIDDVLAAWAPDEVVEEIHIDEPPPLPTELGVADSPVRAEDDTTNPDNQNEPDEPSVAQASTPRYGLLSVITGVLVAAVLGALGTIWMFQPPVGSEAQEPVEQTSSIPSVPGRSQKQMAIAVAPQQTEPPVGEAGQPGIVATKSEDQGVKELAVAADAALEQPIKPSDSQGKKPGFTGVDLKDGPSGMVSVRGGLLRLGLGMSQVGKAIVICREDRARFDKSPCQKIAGEIGNETAEVKSFYLDKTEVSQAAYKRCVRAKKCRSSRTPWELKSQPITGITRQNASAYCSWRGARLPTHREWLYAVRGPDRSALFPWGDEPPIAGKTARANSGRYVRGGGRSDRRDRNKYAGPIGIFGDVDSPFGAINLVGNVREWTSTGEMNSALVVGGGWQNAPHQLRSSRLDKVKGNKISNDIGFRCAKSPKIN